MTEEQCKKCEDLKLCDGGDHYVAIVSAECKKQKDQVQPKEGPKIFLIDESVNKGKVCAFGP
jgi:hypothetical protein